MSTLLGFFTQLKHHSSVSQYGQLNGALKLDGTAIRAHFKEILYNRVCFIFRLLSLESKPIHFFRFSMVPLHATLPKLSQTLKKKALETLSIHCTSRARPVNWVLLRLEYANAWDWRLDDQMQNHGEFLG